MSQKFLACGVAPTTSH